MPVKGNIMSYFDEYNLLFKGYETYSKKFRVIMFSTILVYLL